ncbi:unnamed protein product [Medioppia subpectinata]|uniref:Uncharacterized protein n=1 Tax=Medioppia subpectinata TaxID=1979941 RepID=A0A7R9L2J1_9ACAR|nr:unnamed protein product [Medioppia subpectinata]CAG2113221.1 unnamed protein product [Medioppia subpectinata]
MMSTGSSLKILGTLMMNGLPYISVHFVPPMTMNSTPLHNILVSNMFNIPNIPVPNIMVINIMVVNIMVISIMVVNIMVISIMVVNITVNNIMGPNLLIPNGMVHIITLDNLMVLAIATRDHKLLILEGGHWHMDRIWTPSLHIPTNTQPDILRSGDTNPVLAHIRSDGKILISKSIKSLYSQTGTFSKLTVTFTLRREFGHFILDIYIPSILFVISSWTSFWVEIPAAPARVTLGK